MKVIIPDSAGAESTLEIFKLEYKGTPVLTTKQLAAIFGCSAQSISTNFRSHEAEFIIGVDYYFLAGKELKEFKQQLGRELNGGNMAGINIYSRPIAYSVVSNLTSSLYLWCRNGVFKHSNFLSTDKAKIICAGLLLGYFKADEFAENPAPSVQQTLFADEPLTPKSQPSSVETTPCTTRLEILMEFIRLCKDDNLRDVLIREAASLLLGKQI